MPKTNKRKLKKAFAANAPVGESRSYASGRIKKNGKLKKGFNYTSDIGSNRIPITTIGESKNTKKPMRAVKSGTRGDKPKTTIKNKARSL